MTYGPVPALDVFDLQRLQQQLSDTRFANHLHHFSSVDSTNLVALKAALAPDGSVFFAEEQTAGRGRGNHGWHSAARNGLYVSVLVRPSIALDKALWLSLIAGMAVRTAIVEVTGLRADIRWPNDILLNERKCCGILVETTANSSGILRHAVIGIGINVNHQRLPGELETLATSLRIETGALWQRQNVMAALLRALEHEITLLEAEVAGEIAGEGVLDRFRASSSWVDGKLVSVSEGEGYTGITAGLNKQGYLQVRDTEGALRTVLSGGVRAR